MVKIYNEDYIKTIPKLSDIKMVIAQPPDSSEIGLSPTSIEYDNFLNSFCMNMTTITNLICVIITDRKKDGIIPKHSNIIQSFKYLNYRLLSYKIWKKSNNTDLFRPTIAHIMIFARGKIKQRHDQEYELDIWEHKHEKYGGFTNGFPVKIIEKIILNFTETGDYIYDPFMGSGTTALVTQDMMRNCIGSELDENTYNLCIKRLNE